MEYEQKPLFAVSEDIESGWINVYHYGDNFYNAGYCWETIEQAVKVEDKYTVYRIRVIPKGKQND